MLETSSDLLNIVIAFCVLWLTVFICWFLYYMVSIIRRVSETMETLARMAENINGFFQEAKSKMQKATSYLPLIVDGVKQISNYFAEDEEENSTSKKTKSKRKK